jgi:predicted DCC family thiol-disulfide oxidoreductase YuxK
MQTGDGVAETSVSRKTAADNNVRRKRPGALHFLSHQVTASPLPRPSNAGDFHACAPIVFFDGVCGLCNRTVDFLIRHDRKRRLKFAPLQGATAGRTLPEEIRNKLNTLVFLTEGGRTYVRSAAAVRILNRLGGGWRVAAALLWLIPFPLRNLGYRAVAASRYRLFGQLESCRMPTEADRERLLP